MGTMMQQNAYVTKYDLEYEIAACPSLMDKIKSRDDYAQNLYAAMCNMRWQKTDVMPILKDELWHVSWRSAGGVVADLRGQGDYMDWYCSGMGGFGFWEKDSESFEEWQARTGYVSESTVTEEIRSDLRQLGWHPVPWED
jgi:hypothetical protein